MDRYRLFEVGGHGLYPPPPVSATIMSGGGGSGCFLTDPQDPACVIMSDSSLETGVPPSSLQDDSFSFAHPAGIQSEEM